METLIAIGIMIALLSVYASVLTTIVMLRRVQNNFQATNLIQEELDALRALPFDELVNRTNGNFLGFPIMRGPWKVATVTGAPSGAKAFQMLTAQTPVVQETGLAVLPGNVREDFTFTAKVRAKSSSPVGWGAGIAFRYRDAENHYRFRFTSGGIALDKVVRGTVTTIWSQSAAYSTETWYTLEVVESLNDITVKRNGVTLATQTDYAFNEGDLALIALNGGLAEFDDVAVTAGSTTTWNFDADADGTVPVDWQRMSYADLSGGTGTVTITDYLGQTKVKEAVVTITWTDAGQTRSAGGRTIIHK